MKKLILLLCLIGNFGHAKTTTYLRTTVPAPEKSGEVAPKPSAPQESSTAPAASAPAATPNETKAPAPIQSKINVVTTLSVLASITKAIGTDRVQVNSLSSASEDPHFVKAKPTFKKWVSDADLFIQIGRSLELWVPLVINSSGNQKLISGERLITASNNVTMLEVPSALSRAAGDIHPQGNPHVWLSPLAVLKMAENIMNALIKVDTKNQPHYEKNFSEFKQQLSEAMFGQDLVKAAGTVDFLWRLLEGQKLKQYVAEKKKTLGGWLKSAAGIDYTFITYHTEFSYLAHDFGLKVLGQIEEKSGIAPSARYQNELIKKAKENLVKHIVAATYYVGNTKLIETIANGIGGNKLFIQVDCSIDESYIAMMNRIIKSLVDFRGAVRILPAPVK